MIQVVDPGHGGKDSGTVGNGLREKDLTLDIAHRVSKKLEEKYQGVDAKMTRLTDKYVSLQGRCDFANRLKATAFLSIHINSGGGTGFESFVMKGALPTSAGLLQKNVHKFMSPILKKHGLKDRGQKVDTQSGPGRIHVLRATKMKACLVEIGFIDAKKDSKLLKSDAFLDEVAEALADAMAATEGLRLKKKPTPKPKPDPKPTPKPDQYIRVQINGKQKHAFSQKKNAVDWFKETVKAGDTVNIKR